MAIGSFSAEALQRPSLEAALLGNTPMQMGGHPSNVGFQAYANAMQRRAGRQYNEQLGPYNELVAALMEQHGQRAIADSAAGHVVGARDTMADPVSPLFDILEFAGMPGLTQDPMQEVMNAGRALTPNTENVENTAAAAASLANAGQAMPQGTTPEQLQTGHIGPTAFDMSLINDPNGGSNRPLQTGRRQTVNITPGNEVVTDTNIFYDNEQIPPLGDDGSMQGQPTTQGTTPEQMEGYAAALSDMVRSGGRIQGGVHTQADGSMTFETVSADGTIKYTIPLNGPIRKDVIR